MTYKINGTTFLLPPTRGGWNPRRAIGIDGNGHPIYPPTREYNIHWQIMSAGEYAQIQDFFDAIHITGSAVADLPEYGNSTYQFYAYTGCVVHELQFSRYFTEYPTKAQLKITNIRT